MRMVYLALFLFGGGAYVLLELAWRGRSHASMLAAGGVCLTLLYGVFTHVPAVLPLRCALGACVITAVEFVAGAIVNVRLRLASGTIPGCRTIYPAKSACGISCSGCSCASPFPHSWTG